MPANITPLPHAHDSDFTPGLAATAVGVGGIESPASADSQTESDARMRNLCGLAPRRSQVALIIGGIVAALLGGAVGYWLGSRRAARTPVRVRQAASTAESLIGLAPVALQLMGNPLVRSLALRLLMRQITGRRAA